MHLIRCDVQDCGTTVPTVMVSGLPDGWREIHVCKLLGKESEGGQQQPPMHLFRRWRYMVCPKHELPKFTASIGEDDEAGMVLGA